MIVILENCNFILFRFNVSRITMSEQQSLKRQTISLESKIKILDILVSGEGSSSVGLRAPQLRIRPNKDLNSAMHSCRENLYFYQIIFSSQCKQQK